MTMLDRMRRYRNLLKWSLGLVVVAFIFLYVPDFLRSTAGAAGTGGTLADVEGQVITIGEFTRLYNTQLQAAKGAYGNVNEQLLKQLGFDRQILNQLIDERAALAEATRLGISATDAEVRERIVRLPGLQENGQFIGEQRYRQLLSMQRPPLTTAEFEDSLRRALVVEKLQGSLADWISVTDADVDAEYRRRNEQVKLAVVPFSADAFRGDVTVSDDQLKSFFEDKKETYRIGEKRKIRFLPVSVQAIRTGLNISAQDVETSYDTNIQQYSTPEQIRASHILLKTEGKDEATVRKTAEDLLAKAKGGADFAKLATEFSEDDGSKERGGDLDFFGKGRMVPEFEEAAFKLEPGQMSDLVKTQYGFHIIKLTDRRAANVRSLQEVGPQIAEQLKWERAQQLAQQTADKLAPQIKSPGDLDTVAKAGNLTVQESGFFASDEPIAGLGPSPEAAAQAFGLEPGKVSGAVRTADGFAFLTVLDKQAPRLPTLDEVKDKVREDAVKVRAVGVAKEKAAQIAPTLKAAADFDKAARDAGLTVEKTEMIGRGAAIPVVGVSPAVDAAAFALGAGAVSDPIETPNGPVVVKVLEKKEVSPAEVAASRDTTRRELTGERRGRFFSSYMAKAKQRMKIRIDSQALQRITA
ncbi:MAG: peptidylprolyl isomerase [Vicinamibacterales bacterium]